MNGFVTQARRGLKNGCRAHPRGAAVLDAAAART